MSSNNSLAKVRPLLYFLKSFKKWSRLKKNLQFAPISSIVTNRNGENVNNKSRTYANEQWIRISEGMENVGQQFVGISSTSVVFFEALRKVAQEKVVALSDKDKEQQLKRSNVVEKSALNE